MNELRRITAALDDETAALVARQAEERGLSVEDYAGEALRRMVESRSDLDALIRVGKEQAARGQVVAHDEVMAELDAMIAKHRAR